MGVKQKTSYVGVMSALCQTCQAFWNDEIVIRDAFQLDLSLFSVNVVYFCEPRFDTDITVWIRPRFLSSRFELVDERLPLGIAGGQSVLKYVSTDDVSELTMYSLPPVRIFPKVR